MYQQRCHTWAREKSLGEGVNTLANPPPTQRPCVIDVRGEGEGRRYLLLPKSLKILKQTFGNGRPILDFSVSIHLKV